MLYIITISLIFGISQKLADAVNEHGTILFRGANLLFGIIFGISGALLISTDNSFNDFYLGLIIYWLLANKIDYFNHQLSVSIMLIVAFLNTKSFDTNVINVLIVILIFISFKLLKKYLSKYLGSINYLIDKKLHHLIIAIIIGIWYSNWSITISIIFTILGIIGTIKVLKISNNYNNCNF